MKLPIITVLISFVLESILSKFIAIDTKLFEPLTTIVALVIIYPYFRKYENRYYYLLFGTGLLYDIMYTNTFLLNAIIFVILGVVIKHANKLFSSNFINISLVTAVTIIIYRIITYLILCIINYLSFDIKDLFFSLTSCLLLNMIYSIILYMIIEFIYQRSHRVKLGKFRY